jgi:hypothetical protein
MNATGKDGRTMSNMSVNVRSSGKEPDFTKTAGELLKRCREFYKDPENVKRFEEWKEKRAKAESA